MKKILLTTMLFCLSATMIFAQNLITNGGFETWTDTDAMPDNWARSAGTYGTHYKYATDPVQGNIFNCTDMSSPTAKRFNNNSNINITGESTYRVTFKVKGTVFLRALTLFNSGTSGTTPSTTNVVLLTPVEATYADWTTLQYDIPVPSTAVTGNYKLFIHWSNTSKPNDFYIDDVTIVEYVPEPNDKLQKIEIKPAGYTPFNDVWPDVTIPGFDEETLNYTFTSSYKEVPEVIATAVDGTATVDIVQATSLTGTQVERTATITVTTTDSNEKTYTVEFIKHPGFISGIAWDVTRTTSNFIDWESSNGLYSRTSNQSAGNIYAFGNTSARCNSTSTTGYHLTTPELGNGASTLSFYLKNTDVATDNSEVVVKKSTTAAPDWVEVERVQPNTSDYNNVWKEVNMNINSNAAGLKIRFEFENKPEDFSGKVYLDDVLIQAYSPLSNIQDQQSTKPAIFGSNGRIIFTNANETSFVVYHINGSKMAEGIASNGSSISLQRGIYIVKTSEQTLKVVL
jgi:hypothetical protein